MGLRRDITWRFVMADVQLPIIGVNRLSHYGLLVDCRNNRLLNGVTSVSTPGHIAPPSVSSVKVITGGTPPDKLPGGTPGPDQTKRDPTQGAAQYHAPHPHNTQLPTSLPPTPPCSWPLGRGQGRVRFHVAGRYSQTCRGPMAIRPPSQAQEGQRLEALWRLPSPERSHYPWSIPSPTHTGLRPSPFRVHRLLKNWHREGLSSNSCPSWRYTKDCNYHTFSSFWIPFYVLWSEKRRQNFSTFYGRDPKNLDFCFACLDIHVFSRSSQEHDQHLRTLFTKLQTYGILLNPSKCVFRVPEISFLGYKISSRGSKPLPERVADLQACPSKTVSQLRRFLGMLNFYWHFLLHIASIQAPLHDVLSGPKVKHLDFYKYQYMCLPWLLF